MVTIMVDSKYDNYELDRYLKAVFSRIPNGYIFKAIRTKKIKINDTRVSRNIHVMNGDKLDIYISDDLLYGNEVTQLDIAFEDENIIIINKQPGIPVMKESEPNEISAIELVEKYLKKEETYKEGTTAPALCHRLDRNTGGLLIVAKTDDALDITLDAIKNRQIAKYYKCIVVGVPKVKTATLKHYLFKDNKKSQVYISDVKKDGYVEIITKYKVLEEYENSSLLEVELVTGKTHQIRAHLAYIGHPIVGDGKYGSNKVNKTFGAKFQALWAYKLVLNFGDSKLSYLNDKIIKTDNINFPF